MNFRWLKHMMPRGLYGRAALILIVPVVTLQLVVSVVFIQRHFERVTRQMTGSMSNELALLQEEVARAPDLVTAQEALTAVAGPLQLNVVLPAPDLSAAPTDRRGVLDLTGIVVISTLRANLERVEAVDLTADPGVSLRLATDKGPMLVEFARARVSASNPHQLLVLMLAVGLFMTLIAFLFLRNQLRPIKRLARAAEEFGKGRVVPYRVSGATEVRSAGSAFLHMRARIERHIEQRTLMLSGVSHDLRTPLTRLRLGLSMLPRDRETEDEIAAMERDVDEMNKLVDAFLDFAREGALAGDPETLDPCAFVADVVADAQRAGQAVTLAECPGQGVAETTFRPDALRRALENLIGNAVRYGKRAEVSVRLTTNELHICVEDDGPGIPPDQRAEALKPFARLDPARNQDRGQGVGLGLSIAADILRGHGGGLRLGQSEALGGLRAEMVLPR
ncbi:ATP-binding protein [Pseudothioclava nitratireducens]|uniref:ATP-binding protein n=1 Tax=Pseudothioclava nitratireducens TaxID=1928646 RepID=UPI0023DA80CD|nr:ATP-binding protein [Defluviimonas nitratireducens]MDF1621630.1 ATP-binding protein [Defluviimonas nitratireducens]